MVEVSVARLGLDSASNSYVVILREREGRRLLPIWIGKPEAESIAYELNHSKALRPSAHDLCKSIITSLGGTLDRVNITRMQDSTYYAELLIKVADGIVHIDARPSDSIAIALRFGAPIFAPEILLTAIEADGDDSEMSDDDADDDESDLDEAISGSSGRSAQSTDEMNAEQLKAYLARLRPEDFGKFIP